MTPGETVVVHIQPRAKVTEVVGRHGDAIKIRIQSPPVDGAANDELVRYVAACCGVPRSSVRVVAGASSRRKRLAIAGKGAAEVVSDLLRAAG